MNKTKILDKIVISIFLIFVLSIGAMSVVAESSSSSSSGGGSTTPSESEGDGQGGSSSSSSSGGLLAQGQYPSDKTFHSGDTIPYFLEPVTVVAFTEDFVEVSVSGTNKALAKGETMRINNVYVYVKQINYPDTVVLTLSLPDDVIKKPDFTASIAVSNAYPKIGETVKIQLTFKNQGTYLGHPTITQNVPGTDVSQLIESGDYLPALPGETFTRTFYKKFDQPGPYMITSKIDVDNSIDELDESNNEASYLIIAQPNAQKPDLGINQVNAPSNIQSGNSGYFSIELKNYGQSASGVFEVDFYFDNIFYKRETIQSLSSQGSYWYSLPYTFLQGGHNLKVAVDPNNQISETSETNNNFYYYFYVPPLQNQQPDFMPSFIQVSPNNPKQGDEATIKYKFQNDGEKGAQFFYSIALQGPTSNKYTASISESQSLVSTNLYLGPGETYSSSITTKLPSEGYYTITAKADPYNQVEEKNEDNNQLTNTFYVSPAVSTDLSVYLDGKFYMAEGQTAKVVDFKNMKIEMLDINSNSVEILVSNLPSTTNKIILHRDHKNCADDSYVTTAPNGGKDQVFEVGEGTNYWNYKCQNRKQEQCYDDGSFDVYYDEWCEYPETVDSEKLTIYKGSYATANGVNFNLLDISNGNALMLVSKKAYDAKVNIGITPRTDVVSSGDTANYKLIITDRHTDSQMHYYNIKTFGLPFRTDLPASVGVRAGNQQIINFQVFTSQLVQITGLKEISTGSSTSDSLVFSTEEEAQEYCLNNAESEGDYNSCASSVSAKSSAVKIETGSDYLKKYNFAIRVYSDVSDVAFASLHIQNNEVIPPEFPNEQISIKLEKGWNLVSADGNKIISFKDNSCSQKLVAFVYLDDQQRYVSITKAKDILGDGLTDYLSKHSFWVYAYNDCKLVVEIEKYINYNDLALRSGWNMLPITQDMIGQSLESMGGNCNLQKIYTWDPDEQSWNAISEEYIFQSEDVHRGIIVKAEGYCQLGNTIISNPPEFPAQ